MTNWISQDLHVDLTTCAADSHVSRVKNAIWFVKERIRCIQSETPFTKATKRLTVEMVKRVTILINLFRIKSGVHSVMSPRQLMFGKKFKTPLFKIGELVMAYNVSSNNKTSHALYIGPNDSGTGYTVFKLITKRLVMTRKCKPNLWPKM